MTKAPRLLKPLLTAAILLIAPVRAHVEPLKIRLGYVVPVTNLASILFANDGIAKHNGKTYVVDVMRHQASTTQIIALANGELDIALLGFTSLPLAIENARMDNLGQWDRWSGGNVEATSDGSRVYFVARDNGGANMSGPGTFAKYSRIVTRFDRTQIQRVERLVQLLSDRDQSAQLVAALHLSSDPRFLLNRAQTLLAFVSNQASQHNDAAYFEAR
jgi:hypothetical protein